MSALTDVRDLMASGHYNECTMFGKTVTLYNMDGVTPFVTGSSLQAKVRTPSKREQEVLGTVRGVTFDAVVEIARQGTFTGVGLTPERHMVSVDGTMYQITSIQNDDAGTSLEPAVFTLYCVRLGGQVGAFAR